MRPRLQILLIAAVVLVTGCASVSPRRTALPSLFKKDAPKSAASTKTEAVQYQTPVKMLLVWKDSIRSAPGQPSLRGFGGRVFFYDANGNTIRTEGDLIIYGFDDSNTDRDTSEADQKFVFSKDKFQEHYSMSGLGESYSFWIPWDRVGDGRKSVALIPFFKAPDGAIVRGGQSIYTLRGPEEDTLEKIELASNKEGSGSKQSEVSTVGYTEGSSSKSEVVTADGQEEAETPSQRKVRTTTIDLPATLKRRLAESIATQNLAPRESRSRNQGSSTSRENTNNSTRNEAQGEDQPTAREARPRSRNVFGKPGEF